MDVYENAKSYRRGRTGQQSPPIDIIHKQQSSKNFNTNYLEKLKGRQRQERHLKNEFQNNHITATCKFNKTCLNASLVDNEITSNIYYGNITIANTVGAATTTNDANTITDADIVNPLTDADAIRWDKTTSRITRNKRTVAYIAS